MTYVRGIVRLSSWNSSLGTTAVCERIPSTSQFAVPTYNKESVSVAMSANLRNRRLADFIVFFFFLSFTQIFLLSIISQRIACDVVRDDLAKGECELRRFLNSIFVPRVRSHLWVSRSRAHFPLYYTIEVRINLFYCAHISTGLVFFVFFSFRHSSKWALVETTPKHVVVVGIGFAFHYFVLCTTFSVYMFFIFSPLYDANTR